MSERLLLNVATAAATAGVGSTMIRKEIKCGRLPARKLGKLILLSIDDLHAWIDAMPRVAA
jgi:excisionase family DNA binding protein